MQDNNQPPKVQLKLQNKLQVVPYLVVKLANYLSLKEEDVVNLITNLEQTEEFQKLVSLKIVSRTYFPKSVSVKTVYQYDDTITSSVYDTTAEILDVVAQNPDVVKLIRKIGQENYKKFFLSYETYSFKEIAEQLKISVDEVKQIFEFTNNVLIYSELQYPVEHKIPEKKYIKIAKICYYKQQPVIVYYTPAMLRGQYVINYEKLHQTIDKIPRSERTKIKKLIRELELLNIRKTTLHRILETIAIVQKEFLLTDSFERRRVLTQKKLAEIIGVNPSAVCRIIKDKVICGPTGKEYKLTTLIPTKKEVMTSVIKDLLYKMRKRKITDEKLRKIIYDTTGIILPRRTVNYYRNLVKKENKTSHED